MPVSGKRSVLEVPLTALCSVAVEEAGRAAAGAVLAPERQRPACGGAGVARRKSWLSGCRLDECVLPQHDSGYTAQANRSPDDQQKETVEGETPPHWSCTSCAQGGGSSGVGFLQWTNPLRPGGGTGFRLLPG